MTTENDILELKFDGNGVSPSTVKPAEIAQLVADFEEILIAQIKQDYPEINTDEVLFTFENIKNESLGIPFTKKIIKTHDDVVGKSYAKITKAISSNDYSELPEKALKGLRGISRFTQQHGCVGQFKSNNNLISTITPTTEIPVTNLHFAKGVTTIYGEITDVGSNIHLKLNEGYSVVVDTDKETSKKLGSRLWEEVGFRGSAVWDITTSKITKFKLLDILEYNPTNIVDAFVKLRKETSGFWDSFSTNDEINQQLLRD